MLEKAGAVRAVGERDIQGFGVIEGLLSTVTDGMAGVLRSDNGDGDVRVVVDESIGHPSLAAGHRLAANGYALNQWDALSAYATRGFLAIDNNAAERALKRVAIGRKNWLFAGNDKAGGTAAMLYTLIASAERHGVDPQRYLTSVLAKTPSTPAGELDQLLPDVWKADGAAGPVSD